MKIFLIMESRREQQFICDWWSHKDNAWSYTYYGTTFKFLSSSCVGTHAPNIISGVRNRTVAWGSCENNEVELRQSCDQTNPYMLISSIVLGVNEGIEKQIES